MLGQGTAVTKEHWTPDKEVVNCEVTTCRSVVPGTHIMVQERLWPSEKLNACCRQKFSLKNRRHHCRLCGLCVCKKCSNRKVVRISVPPPTIHAVDRSRAGIRCCRSTGRWRRGCRSLFGAVTNVTQPALPDPIPPGR